MRLEIDGPVEILQAGPPGPAGIVYQGSWSSKTTYAARSVVTHDRGLWYAVRGGTAIRPGSNPAYWLLMLPPGTKGDQGETPTLEWQISGGTLQVRRVGDTDWTTLSPLADLGQRILDLSADPTPADGNDGDFALNKTTQTLFGPKAAGAWPTPGLKLRVVPTVWPGVAVKADLLFAHENRVWRSVVDTSDEPSEASPDWELLYRTYATPVAWQTGVTTAVIDGQYAFNNIVWRALAETGADPSEVDPDWEKLYDGAAITHDHDDRYYTEAEVDTALALKADTTTVNTALATKLDLAGGTLTGPVYGEQTDLGTVSSGTATFDLSADPKQKLTVGGAITVALSNKPTDAWEVEVELVNGGAYAITWPAVSWLVGDGTTSTTFADMGVTLESAGTNTVILWGVGTGTVYGKAG